MENIPLCDGQSCGWWNSVSVVTNGNSCRGWAVSGIAVNNSGGPDDCGSLWWSGSSRGRPCVICVRRNNDGGLWCRSRLDAAPDGWWDTRDCAAGWVWLANGARAVGNGQGRRLSNCICLGSDCQCSWGRADSCENVSSVSSPCCVLGLSWLGRLWGWSSTERNRGTASDIRGDTAGNTRGWSWNRGNNRGGRVAWLARWRSWNGWNSLPNGGRICTRAKLRY